MPAPFKLVLHNNFAQFARQIDERATKHLAFAQSRALTDTARDLAKQLTADIPDIFGKATPFTRHAIGFTGSSRTNLTASVFVKAVQSQYLLHEEIGGTRTAAENTTQPGQALVLPGSTELKALPGLPRNAYDNMPAKVLAKLRAAAEQTKRDHRQIAAQAAYGGKLKGARLKAVAAGQSGVVFLDAAHVPAPFAKIGGYFRRGPGNKLYRLTTFEASEHYTPKFGFKQRFEHEGARIFAPHMRARMLEALRGG